MDRATDVVVVGGGLSGLTAAAFAGRAGLRVTLLEKARETGGRAATSEKGGFSMNLGAHALYRNGPAWRALGELGVTFSGGRPKPSGGYAFHGGTLHTLPAGFLSMMTTGLFGLPAKLEIARLLARLGGIDPAPLQGVTLAKWLGDSLKDPVARALVATFLRVATYTEDPERQSAGAAIAQLQAAYKHDVLYLDGGWKTLVDGLERAARAAGVEIVAGAKAEAIELAGGAVTGVRLADGSRIAAGAVIVAASPHAASALAKELPVLAGYAEHAVPVEAACLDVALSSLPRPGACVAFGVDRPLYASVHSAVARLAPEGGALVQLMSYRPGDPRADEAELLALLAELQPGFRERVVEQRFLPSMIVSNALVTAEGGGVAGRPGVKVPDVHGLLLCGDWVGAEGQLADASLASAREAASQVKGGAARKAA